MKVLRNSTSLRVVVACVGLIGLFSGCNKNRESISSHPASLNAKKTIRIGEVGSMTGSDATFGISTHQGILLAIREANEAGGVSGKQLELITLDDQGKPSEAVVASTKLVTQERVQALLGEVASTLSIA